jgi:hypothetical protein
MHRLGDQTYHSTASLRTQQHQIEVHLDEAPALINVEVTAEIMLEGQVQPP